MIKWPDMNFGPVNLWSAPRQDIYVMREEIEKLEKDIDFGKLRATHHKIFMQLQETIKKNAERRLKDIEFIYYTRTGRFPE